MAPNDEQLLVYLDELMARLRELLSLATEMYDVDAIHKSRVTTRRLSAAMKVVGVLAEQKDVRTFNRVLKKIRRELGPHRDVEVLSGHAWEIGGEGAAWMLERLGARRAKLRDRTARREKLPRWIRRLEIWSEVREGLETHAEAFGVLVSEGVHARADRFAALAKELVDEPGKIDPHLVRKAGKELRYALELVAASGTPLSKEMTRIFKRMQDALGLWHDHVVLGETAVREVDEVSLLRLESGKGAAVMGLAAATLSRAAAQLAEFGRVWDTEGREMAAAIGGAVPLVGVRQVEQELPTEQEGGEEGTPTAEIAELGDKGLETDPNDGPVPDQGQAETGRGV